MPDAEHDLQEFTDLITHSSEVVPSSQLILLRNENIAPFSHFPSRRSPHRIRLSPPDRFCDRSYI